MATRLEVETNSIERADHARAAVEGALGRLVAFVARSHEDPTSTAAGLGVPAGLPEGALPPSLEDPELMLDAPRTMKAQHYARWPDDPLPALGGRTAREAVRTKDGRKKVDVLLREMELHDGSLPEAERFDFAALRRELGLK
ncbi:MAG: hypothetical protein DRJ42_26550 [Deltaproteobacteria bacterium]|nr:MAG: hypothetical protein DRJ42_26550 [Deltaproteobacteria bacterium]